MTDHTPPAPRSRARGRRARAARLITALHLGPNMTPMVDVVMVILIFFMASASLLGPELLLGAAIAPRPAVAPPTPQAQTQAQTQPRTDAQPPPLLTLESPAFTARLTHRGRDVTVTGLGLRDAPLDQLRPAAAALAAQLGPDAIKDSPALVLPEDAVPYDAVVLTVETLRAVGFERVGIR